jgi:peptidyl-tRNA hydrolase ICT1
LKDNSLGGQNVNKVNTKVEIRVAYGRVDWIPAEVSLLLENTPFTTSKKELVIKSDRFRSQAQNYQDCINKLYEVIDSAVVVPGETSERTRKTVNDHIQREKSRNMITKQFLSSKKQARRDRS